MANVKAQLRDIGPLFQLVVNVRRARFLADRKGHRARVGDYLRTSPVRRLQLGTGRNVLDGWLNTDIYNNAKSPAVVYLDARKRFPLPDPSFDLVYSEHMIEHIPYRDAQHCLRESFRVMRPGGRIRIATPSLERIISLHTEPTSDRHRRYMRWAVATFLDGTAPELPGIVINNFVRNWGHQFIFDRDTLRHALETAGFTDVRQWGVGESDHPDLARLERHDEIIPPEFNEFETLIMEGTRPSS